MMKLLSFQSITENLFAQGGLLNCVFSVYALLYFAAVKGLPPTNNEDQPSIFGQTPVSGWIICLLPLLFWNSIFTALPEAGGDGCIFNAAFRRYCSTNDIGFRWKPHL